MSAPWHTLYPANVPHEIDTAACRSPLVQFLSAADQFSQRPAFGNFGCYLTYEESRNLAENFAAYLSQECQIKKGDRVAIMLPNVLSYPIAMLGTLMAGATVVNTNPQYTPRELLHQLQDAGPTTIVILKHLMPTLSEVISDTELRYVITVDVGDLLSLPKRWAINSLASFNYRNQRTMTAVASVPFRKALSRGKTFNFAPVQIDPEDIAFLQYTGGTTGLSKGAMLSHRNIAANVLQISAFFPDIVEPGKEVVVTALPLYHIYALTFNCFCFLHHGGLVYLVTDPRNVKRFINEIKGLKFTAISGVNTLYKMILGAPNFDDIDFSRLKYASSGGMAAQSSVANAWQEKTQIFLGESYGLTEASPAVTANPPEVDYFTGSVGIPLPSTECSIRDGSGNELSAEEIGELWVRGPQVMRGYWQNEAATKEILSDDGWLKTGDMAQMDERGMLRIVDRAKDLIIVSGFNVYPNEVEEVAASHPNLVEVAVVGLPNEDTGEAVTLVAVSNSDTLTESEVIDYCRQQLTGYKKPTRVIFTDSLPKSNVGKILRRKVREIIA
ncbi:MAG: AMP-binding protein [Pseudomonadota bacterium]